MSEAPVLLIQIRQSSAVADEEAGCFVETGGFDPGEFHRVNLFSNPNLNGVYPKDYRAVLVGGASDASVLEPNIFPFVEPAQAFMRDLIDAAVPTFASCFGFQLAVRALGGVITHQPTGFEMGTIPIRLTPAASTDPIFAKTPDGFFAVSVHKEKATELPEGCTLLAYTEACVHAFRVNARPFWAFQFHPEVSREVLVSRLTHYQQRYTGGDSHLQAILDAAVPVPESTRLVRNFKEWLDSSRADSG